MNEAVSDNFRHNARKFSWLIVMLEDPEALWAAENVASRLPLEYPGQNDDPSKIADDLDQTHRAGGKNGPVTTERFKTMGGWRFRLTDYGVSQAQEALARRKAQSGHRPGPGPEVVLNQSQLDRIGGHLARLLELLERS